METPARISLSGHTMSSRLRIPKYLKTPSLLSFLVTTIMLLGTLIFFFRIQPQVPLFYSLARASQHLASKYWLFLFPLLSFVINLIHLIIVKIIKHAEQLLIKLFVWTTFGIQLILGLALLRILVIIT